MVSAAITHGVAGAGLVLLAIIPHGDLPGRPIDYVWLLVPGLIPGVVGGIAIGWVCSQPQLRSVVPDAWHAAVMASAGRPTPGTAATTDGNAIDADEETSLTAAKVRSVGKRRRKRSGSAAMFAP